jgi:hypothetical protein
VAVCRFGLRRSGKSLWHDIKWRRLWSGHRFQANPNLDGSWTESVLHRFTGGKDGGSPQTGLIFDAAGNLYGTTYSGGHINYCRSDGGCGVVFKLTSNPDGSWTEMVPHYFGGGSNGGFTAAGVILDAAENLYGTTEGNGWGDVGSVFEITP